MKIKLPAFITVMALAVICIFSSCKKSGGVNDNPALAPLAKFVLADTSLKLFAEILQRSNDIGLLARPDSFTITAPTNDAFISSGFSALIIDSTPASVLDLIARYHFIAAPVNLAPGAYMPYNSLLDSAVYGYKNSDGSGAYFNGNAVSARLTITGSNAILYKLKTPLLVPVDSISHLALTDSTLSYFAEALVRTNISFIPAAGWNTILAPDNSAFINAGYPTISSIDNADSTMLSNILQYHILPGQYFSNYFIGQSSVNASTGEAVAVSYNNGILQFKGSGNSTNALVTKANQIVGTNIILYKINQVLLP